MSVALCRALSGLDLSLARLGPILALGKETRCLLESLLKIALFLDWLLHSLHELRVWLE